MPDNQSRQKFEANLIIEAWQDEAFKQELIKNPKVIYEVELGQKFPENHEIKVLEETSDITYLVIPQKPVTSEELSEEALESVAGGYENIFGIDNRCVYSKMMDNGGPGQFSKGDRRL